MIHGAMLSHEEWAPQLEALASQYRVITCDLRGHANTSCTTGPYSVLQFAEDVPGLLNASGVDSFSCCGHSPGGMIAQQVARLAPQRLEALVLAETSHGTSSTVWEAIQSKLARWTFRLMSVSALTRLSARKPEQWHPKVGAYLGA